MPMTSSTSLFTRWVLLCATAEFLGIAAAAVWYGGIHATIGEPEPIPFRFLAWLLMSLAAVPEGLILGGIQSVGVKLFILEVSARRWIVATVLVGFAGWGIGTFIPMFVITEAAAVSVSGSSSEIEGAVLFAAAFGVAIGTVFGAAQSWALPRGRSRRLSWTIANAVGWAFALPMIYAAAHIASEYPGWGTRIAIWASGGLGAGLLIGIATGIALLRMRRTRSSRVPIQRQV